jgi:hypothetical protein
MNYRDFMDEYGTYINIILIMIMLSFAIHKVATENAKIKICESLDMGYVDIYDTCMSCEDLGGIIDDFTGQCLVRQNPNIFIFNNNGTNLNKFTME